MSQVIIHHPAEWIGIPEDFPYDEWETADDWAGALVAALAEDAPPPTRGEYERLRVEFTRLAETREDRGAVRTYASLDEWTGPLYVADVVDLPTSLVGDTTLELLAGANDPTAVEQPIIEEFVTDSGAQGVRSVRYTTPDNDGSLLVRADYIFPTSTGFLRLYTAQFDLVDFEHMRPLLEKLAATISISG